MKKLLVLIIVLAIIVGAAFAGDNQSAKYIRMLSREAATDSIDVAYFNPAGTAFLQKGFHVQLNGQTVYLDYAHTFMGTEYSMEKWIPFVPSAYLGYAGGNWSAFTYYNIPEGGGSVEYDNIFLGGGFGSIEATEATHAIALGGSFAFNEMISIGAKAEISIESDSYSVNAAFAGGLNEITAGGIGFGGTFGVHIIPTDGLNFSVTVESAQSINVETKDSSGLGAAALEAQIVTDADRPWKIRTGLSYAFPFGLEVPVSFKYSFWNAVDPEKKQDSWSTALGLRYFLTDTLEISVGGSYATGNVEDEDLDSTYFNPELDSVTIAGGIGWEIFKDFDLDIGVLYPFYLTADGTNFTDMEKQVVDMAIGITYVF